MAERGEATAVGIATGAGRGMGFTCAQRLAATVDVVVLVDRDEAGLTAATEALTAGAEPARLVPVALDVTDAAGVATLADRVAGLGRLRAVAHAAGISPTMADWRAILAVDLVGSARLLDALFPLAGEGTAVVCFASMAAHLLVAAGDPTVDAVLDDPLAPDFLDRIDAAAGPSIHDSGTAYAWAKRGVQRLVQREAVRFGAVGARVNSISPGMIDTPQGRQEAAAQPAMKVLLDRTPLRREGRADEIAAVVSFLLSDEASFLTGSDLLVDGGVVAALAGARAEDW
jgi:NAD(P)-dependent dehydrogenase (short-subunit alcohol dehydrogenase family)